MHYQSNVSEYVKKGEERMKAILQQMYNLHDSGDDHVRPCTVSYNILLDFYAKTSQVDKAEECLTYMNEMHMSGKHHVKPDVISYNSAQLKKVFWVF